MEELDQLIFSKDTMIEAIEYYLKEKYLQMTNFKVSNITTDIIKGTFIINIAKTTEIK